MWADPVWISSLKLLTVATTGRTVGPLHLWQIKVSLGYRIDQIPVEPQIWCFPMSAPVGMDNHGWDLVG